ncbi:YbdD/YjiX family protein [Povalibacter sp.]|uniref:YbdD/YjiX family protein n=1 Tax=Povalibacter sp. TaxID=1962978 RepID=UPI002F407540
MKKRLQTLWQFLRTLATDNAYEQYLQHHRGAHADQPPMSRRAFYLHQQQRKWSGVQRCC